MIAFEREGGGSPARGICGRKVGESLRTIKLEEEDHVKKIIAIILSLTMLLASSMAIAETSYNMTWNSTVDPATWNGNPWSGNGGGWFVSLGSEGMFQFARLSDNIYNRLATGISHDGNVTTVTLRQGALYSDPPLFLSKYISQEVLDKYTLYTPDAAKAEQLLTDSGYIKKDGWWCYSDGTQIKVVIGVNGGWQPATVVANVCSMVGDQLKAFGIYSEVLVVESTMYSERLKNNEFCMCFDWIDVSWSFSDPYFTLKDFFGGGYAVHMGIPVDEATGLPVYEGLVDFNGEPTDPIALINSMPYLYDEADRLAIAERLSWIANEYCFGINLYQNVTGIWENRATTAGLPHADEIDANGQFMPVPTVDDPEFAEIVNLNWGFSGYMKLFYLYPNTAE